MKNKINKIKKDLKTTVRRSSKEFSYLQQEISKKASNLKLMHWTFPKKMFLGLLIILLIGACLLYAPISFNYESYEYIDNKFHFVLKNNFPNEYIDEPNRFLEYNFLDALFMASSAFTNTGFSLVNIGYDFSAFGQFVTYVLIQVGGFGYISLFYLIGMALRNVTKKNLFSTSLLNIERGGTKVSNSSKMILRIFIIILFIQLLFSIIISLVLCFYPFKLQENWNHLVGQTFANTNYRFQFTLEGNEYNFSFLDQHINKLFILTFDNVNGDTLPTYGNYGLSLWHGLFMTGSAINNAGLDVFGSTSIAMFRNDVGVFIQICILFLLIIGGIGFPVIYDISLFFEWFYKYKIKYRVFKKTEYSYINKPKLTSFSKICIYTWFFVSLLSLILLFIIEYSGQKPIPFSDENNIQNYLSISNYPEYINILNENNEVVHTIKIFGDAPIFNKNFAIFFSSLSSRSAGFSTIDMNIFTETSIIILSILMFIGTSPSSTGGGIRTTTFAIVVKSLFSWIRGLETTSFFKRKVPSSNIMNSYLIMIIALCLILFMAGIMYITSSSDINGLNLIPDEFQKKSIYYSFSYFLFECASAFSTSGLTIGITNSDSFQWWNLTFLIILMFIGQLGVSSTLLIFARKTPKKIESSFLEQTVRIG